MNSTNSLISLHASPCTSCANELCHSFVGVAPSYNQPPCLPTLPSPRIRPRHLQLTVKWSSSIEINSKYQTKYTIVMKKLKWIIKKKKSLEYALIKSITLYCTETISCLFVHLSHNNMFICFNWGVMKVLLSTVRHIWNEIFLTISGFTWPTLKRPCRPL